MKRRASRDSSGLRAQGSGSARIAQSPEPRAQSGFQRGQSTLEYILVLSAILVGLIVIVSTTIKPAVNQVMTDSGNNITAASAKVKNGLGL